MLQKITIAITLILLTVNQVQARATYAKNGFYASLGGGVGFVSDVKSSQSDSIDLPIGPVTLTGQAELTVKQEHKAGYRIIGAAGFKKGMFRGELELSHSDNKVNAISIDYAASARISGFFGLSASATTDAINFSGCTSSTNIMGNIFADFDNATIFTPFLGVGLGIGIVSDELAITRTRTTVAVSGFPVTTIIGNIDGKTNTTNTLFAFQGIVGTKIHINKKVYASVDYRFTGTTKRTHSAFSNIFVDAAPYYNHSVNAGLGMHFG